MNIAEIVIEKLRKMEPCIDIDWMVDDIKSLKQDSSTRSCASYVEVRDILANYEYYFAHEMCGLCVDAHDTIVQLRPHIGCRVLPMIWSRKPNMSIL